MQKSVVLAVILLSARPMLGFAGAGDQGQFSAGMRQKDRVRQILDSNERIDPERFDDAQLKELGEGVINRVIGDPVLRSWIDETMGGSDSECLKDMYKMIGYRFLHDRYALPEQTNKNRFSTGHAFMQSRIRGGELEPGRNPAGPMPIMGYFMFLFLFISALGSTIYMIRLVRERI
jgi:hypothetical protein